MDTLDIYSEEQFKLHLSIKPKAREATQMWRCLDEKDRTMMLTQKCLSL